ncbi:MAG: PorP/SprF family type IX secretion system membrane protein [Bacteroidota bacterium]
MKLSKFLPILVSLFCWQGLSAQDIHYTLFDYSPLRANPAFTGAFEGSVRIGGLYRGQWFTVGDFAEFTSPSFYADAPIIKGFRDQDWIGVGLFFVNDQFGAAKLRTSGGALSASYHLANKKRTSVLTLGAQYGNMQRRLDPGADLIYEQTIDEPFGGGGGTGTLEFANGANSPLGEPSYTDINVGLLYRTQIDKTSNLEIGVAGLHLNSDNNSLLSGSAGGGGGGGIAGRSERNLTITSHAIYEQQINDDWSINPKLFWQTTEGGGNNLLLQAWMGRKMNEDLQLNFGLGYRAGDAANILLGAYYKDLRVALAYDLNVSGANAITNYQGGFELGAYYIIKIYKQPELPPTILCPRL